MTEPDVIRLYAKQLRLPTLALYLDVVRQAEEMGWGYDDFLCEILRRELKQREENQRKRRIRQARFALDKSLDMFDFTRLPNVEEAYIWQLATGEFVERKENIILIGNPGAGKTHLAIGLGRRLCGLGYRVSYYTAANLVTELSEAQQDRWAMFLKGWDNMELLERLSEEDPAIAQARKALEKMASDPRAKEIYEQRLKAIMDRNSDLYEAELKGMREGKLETARAALLKGADVEFVAEITGLPLETIQKLKAEILLARTNQAPGTGSKC
jgi:hypothetical protein